MNNSEPVLPLEAVQALHKGNRLAAIRHVSRINGTSLKRSKAIVERYIEGQPDMKRHLHASYSPGNIGGLVFFIILALSVYYGFISN